MKILGNRILVSKVEEPKKEGFQTVDVQDSFTYKGKVELVPKGINYYAHGQDSEPLSIGSVVLFAKYSPDTKEVEHEGQKMKIISVDDVLAIL